VPGNDFEKVVILELDSSQQASTKYEALSNNANLHVIAELCCTVNRFRYDKGALPYHISFGRVNEWNFLP
jgi:hypothetical protein